MKQQLSMLVDLQNIDDALRDLRQARQDLVKLEQENKASLEVFDKMLVGLGERIAETRGFYTEKEAEVRETETNITRSKSRLTSITSQKELTALNKELEASRKINQQRNDELVRLLEQLEAAQADFDRKSKERADLAREMEQVESALRGRIGDKEAGVTELNVRRDEIRKSMPRELLARYDRIAKGRNGQALADVTDEGNHNCSACNMAVPPQVYIRLQRMETIEQCANCVRILVLRRALQGETGVGLSE